MTSESTAPVSTFNTDEPLDAARHFAQPTDVESSTSPTSKSVVEEWTAMLRWAIPVLIVCCTGALIWAGVRHRETSKEVDPRDRLLGWAAWLGGKEFDPKKHPFSSQYEIKMPEVKPIDWEEYSRKYDRALQAHQRQLSEQMRRFHNTQRRKARGE